MERKGILVTLEGIDGIGKSTQAQQLADAFRTHGHEVVLTKEPGASKMGNAIRNILFKEPSTKQLDYKAVNLLFIAEHIQTLHDVIRPALNAGKVVICDRYADSNLAYMQALNAHPATVKATRELFGLVPNITVLFIGSPQVMAERANKRPDGKQAGKTWADGVELGKIQLSYERLLGSSPRTIRFEVGNNENQEEVTKRLVPLVMERSLKILENQSNAKNRHRAGGSQQRTVPQPAGRTGVPNNS